MTMEDVVTVLDHKGKNSVFKPDVLETFLISLSEGLATEFINIKEIVEKVYLGLPNRITTDELVNLVAETLASLTTKHYHYSTLASRVLSTHMQKRLPAKFSENFKQLYEYKPINQQGKDSIISEKILNIVLENKDIIDGAIVKERDYDIDYFGFRTLENSYFLRIDNTVSETPQFLFMRVALGIHGTDIDSAIETYELISKKYFIHASPTLFNASLRTPFLSSCFLLAMKDDSIDGIYKTLYDTAMISRSAGGIGLHVSNIRASGTYINGSNGISSGLIPMLKVFNSTAQYVDQGGNKRPGAFCIYLEPWHGDVFDFLNIRKNHGKEEMRARDLFIALWIPDMFMEKVERDEDWCLFSQDSSPGLTECYGDEFNKLYVKYENDERFLRKVKARELWSAILIAQTETGNPFLLYKDRCNSLSNQKNLGVIKSSNLCCEIVEYSSPEETAVCNLASIALPMFVNGNQFDFKKLHDMTKIVIRNLDRVIDVNAYPLENCKVSNIKNRPVGLGVQGLADTFFKLRIPFGSPESRQLNIQIFETIYHGALEQSCKLAQEHGTYGTYDGSPMSQGKLQYDLWGAKPTDLWDWKTLKRKIAKHGVRNSLLVALMPTASTSQIFGFTECFEPITSNIYLRRVLSGEHQVVNRYLVDDLVKLGLWNTDLKNQILLNRGSIQAIEGIPKEIKSLYKTVWEISQKVVIDLAADRAPFIDQSQSMNLFIQDVSFSKLTSMHFYAWKKGLKTGMYYLRTRAAANAIQFSLDLSTIKKRERELESDEAQKKQRGESNDLIHDIYNTDIVSCNLKDPENCESCSA
ncbi:uncharacterized protein C5L36_0D03490 [Pichia kudriavzevii]|uniref:Ribonucleoside-diphosphate reductase n=1 Tax=Pichia kudriavzevii TaxID=4909 RepID=A0A2U9R885_PICKU|nr:uncharacterized protein C5L36_0D03490 [Pichia kudriavzevii]AWU77615.1 hypothetical protein C5L36_0D03490 [Pichia kudriavzevii]